MSLENDVRSYKELSIKIALLEQEKKTLGSAILEQLCEKSLSIAGYTVRRYHRFSITTDLKEARKFGATKIEEVIDKEKLKKLHQSGEDIPGVSLIPILQVSVQKPEP